MIKGDSIEYDILELACDSLKSKKLFTCEIGVREGEGSKIILEKFKDRDHWHIGIDPYGNILYKHFDQQDKMLWNGKPNPPRYSNSMKGKLIKDLSEYDNFSLYQMEDEEFFNKFCDGVPIYRETKEVINKYDLVFFDGPHTTLSVLKEAIFFADRSHAGTVFIFDDYTWYNMDLILKVIVNEYGFMLLKQGKNKIALKRN